VNLSSPRFSRGVTLIELMAVVAAVAILASLAYPAYEEQMRKSRRTDAAGALTSLANAMERFQIANGTYVGAGTTGGDRSTVRRVSSPHRPRWMASGNTMTCAS